MNKKPISYLQNENTTNNKREKESIMKKAMLSQPMNGKTDEEIVATRERAVAALTERGYEIVNGIIKTVGTIAN